MDEKTVAAAIIASLSTLFVTSAPKVIAYYFSQRKAKRLDESLIEVKRIENGAAQRREYRDDLKELDAKYEKLLEQYYQLMLLKGAIELRCAQLEERNTALEAQMKNLKRE